MVKEMLNLKEFQTLYTLESNRTRENESESYDRTIHLLIHI